jgi:DNA-binding NarL/FixJ family response regulator
MGHSPATVVLVDDNDELRSVVAMRLGLDGFRVVAQAADGAGAIEAVAREQPDVVVLDLEMPHMSGVAALPRLREAAPGAAIVVFSCFPDPFTLANVLTLGADLYVDKASGPSTLSAHVGELLATSAAPIPP